MKRSMLFLLGLAIALHPVGGQPPQLDSMTDSDVLVLLAEFKNDRESAINTVKVWLGNEKDAVRRPAILSEVLHVVSSLRAAELIPEIVKLIRFRPTMVGDRPFTPNDYPVVNTLVAIGMPAVNAVMELTLETNDRLLLALYAEVVKGVFGKELGAQYIEWRSHGDNRYELFKEVYAVGI